MNPSPTTELVEQLTRAADRGYTVRGEPDASTLMRQAAEALSAQPTVDREAIKRIINTHVADCLRAAGATAIVPRHPGPAADAILALFPPIDDITYAGSEPEGGPA